MGFLHSYQACYLKCARPRVIFVCRISSYFTKHVSCEQVFRVANSALFGEKDSVWGLWTLVQRINRVKIELGSQSWMWEKGKVMLRPLERQRVYFICEASLSFQRYPSERALKPLSDSYHRKLFRFCTPQMCEGLVKDCLFKLCGSQPQQLSSRATFVSFALHCEALLHFFRRSFKRWSKIGEGCSRCIRHKISVCEEGEPLLMLSPCLVVKKDKISSEDFFDVFIKDLYAGLFWNKPCFVQHGSPSSMNGTGLGINVSIEIIGTQD